MNLYTNDYCKFFTTPFVNNENIIEDISCNGLSQKNKNNSIL